MKHFIFLFAVCCYVTDLAAETITPAAVISIYDGDTFTVDLLNCPDVLCKRIPVRIDGIDAPEMKGKCQAEIDKARLAKQYLVTRLRSGQDVELRNVARDKYFRLRANLWVGGVDVGDGMIKAGLARPYHGEKRMTWCALNIG